MQTKLKVCGHRILVKVDDELALAAYSKDLKKGEVIRGKHIVMEASGVIVRKLDLDMDVEKRGAQSGVVVQVGEDAYGDKTSQWCKVGDRVFFVRYEGREIRSEEIGEEGGISYRVLNDDDIVATLDS